MYLEENLSKVKDKIRIASEKSGRSSNDIRLIAVTKTVDKDIIKAAISLGITDIGENRVQEIREKYDYIGNNVNWHMIGHLQTNKVKYIIDKVKLIHSLDRISLAKELNKRAKQSNIIVNALIQVNVAEEETKYGLKVAEVLPFIRSIENLENIRIKGLMTIAPYAENPEDVRFVFRGLRELFQEIKKNNYKNVSMEYLSMGMTNDYQIAIEEGSNMVRIGTGIFGERNYN